MEQSANIIQNAITKEELKNQLVYLGVNPLMCLEVHCAMKKVGYVVGGTNSLLAALKEVLANGSIVMPSQCSDNTEPLNWSRPPIDLRLAEKVRENTPGYDIYSSDIHHMGALALDLRSHKDTYHSYHPNSAFMAWGKNAKELMSGQPLNFPFGFGSPLDKMYHEENSYILLIGVGYDNATGMHYGESISETRGISLQGGAVKRDGNTTWKKYLDYELDSSDFNEIGKLMEKDHLVSLGKLGDATCRLMKFKDATDYTVAYLKNKYGGK